MAASTSVVAAVLLLALCSSASAFSLFGGPSKPPPPPGAGKSFADVICADNDLLTLCRAIKVAIARSAGVSELTDPTFTATFFAPTNKAFDQSKSRLARQTGVSDPTGLLQNSNAAVTARVLENHVITGQAVQSTQLKNGNKYISALGQTLTVDTGILGGTYIKGPVNTVKITQTDIPAARGYIHKVDGVIVPKK